MGVHGLTTFISRYHHKYKEKIYLHDCPIVIDGCNLMFFLYFEGRHSLPSRSGPASRRSSGGKSPISKISPLRSPHLFGGDYATYAQNVREFFQHLKQCSITPIVIFDGAYDSLKIRTAMKRFAENVKANVRQGTCNGLKGVTPGASYSPVFMKAVFVEILNEQKIPNFQTEHEADCTIAFVARKLNNCPIISSDSDFHMYINAVTLPLASLQFKKVRPKKGELNSSSDLGTGTDPTEDCLSPSNSNMKLWTLHSQYVSLPTLCRNEFNLRDVRLLPLAAVIMGNDWIANGTFSNFHSTTAGGTKVKRITRIAFLLRWLGKQKSYQKVLNAMLISVKESQRQKVTGLVQKIIEIYEGLGGEEKVWEQVENSGSVTQFITKDEGLGLEIASLVENLSLDETTTELINDISLPLEDEIDLEETQAEDSDSDDELDLRHMEEDSHISELPDWYLKCHIDCFFPTYLLKLFRNKMAFLSPQVEISSMPSSHSLSIPIIQVLGGILLGGDKIVTLITRRKFQVDEVKVETVSKLPEHGPLPLLTYDCPSFKKSFSEEQRIQIILETLGLFTQDFLKFILDWPISLRIWIAALVYFVKRSKDHESEKDTFHLDQSTVLPVALGILMSVIKNVVLSPSGKSPVQNVHSKKSNVNVPITPLSDLLLQHDPLNLSKLRQFYAKFEVMTDVSSKQFLKSYDILRPYALSQYTCILFHLHNLNRLLGDPFRSPRLSYNLNNWFVYSFSSKINDQSFLPDSVTGIIDYPSFLGEECKVNDMKELAQRLLGFTW